MIVDYDTILLYFYRYIPTHDLFNIYQELYGATKISKIDIEVCSTLIALERYILYCLVLILI